MPYRNASFDAASSDTGLPMPTLLALLREAWPKIWYLWSGAVLLAVGSCALAYVVGVPGLAVIGVFSALLLCGVAAESSFEDWLSWVPSLSAVYPKRELAIWFAAGLLGSLFVAMGASLALAVALPEDVFASIAMEQGPKLVLLVVATGLFGVRTVLRWRYAARVMRTRVVAEYV